MMSFPRKTAAPLRNGSTSTQPAQRLNADWLVSEPPELADAILGELSDAGLCALPYLFEFWALAHQLPPDGNWRTWAVMGGRGAGKTRAGSEWVRSMVEGRGARDPGRARSVALVGETQDQAREVMVFGPSGIIACSPPDRRPVWQATRRRLVWPNGAVAQTFSAHDPEGLRGPQFDAAWCDEIGCAAIDKGANQPNKFLDPKSSESSLPRYSSGERDDLMQMQYLRAMTSYYADAENNPVSEIYGGPMVDPARIHVWAWDARPYPFFPGNTALWSDGDNYRRGHWLNGRTVARSLGGLVTELAAEVGLGDVDVSKLYGLVRGYTVSDPGPIRAALQPLMLAYGFDAVERDGALRFRSRGGLVDGTLKTETLAEVNELDGALELTRAPEAELTGRLRLLFAEADGDFNARAEEAVLPDTESHAISQSELPLVLTRAEARRIAERWLAESRVARDSARFAIPPSQFGLGAGDVVSIETEAGPASFRIDRLERGEAQLVEAVRVDADLHTPAPDLDFAAPAQVFDAPQPVVPVFLDLPLLRGDEVPHAPHIAAYADDWPGSVAVLSSANGETYALDTLLTRPATVGVTENALSAAPAGVLDRSAPLRVRLLRGALSAVERDEMLNGANAAAIGSSGGDWEVFQFAQATLVAPETYELSMRLRGQAGTDGIMPESWPAGSQFVLLNGAAQQIGLAVSDRGLARRYRVGPAQLGYDHPAYVDEEHGFSGVGLRPYRPVHLRARPDGAGGTLLTWMRRTRQDGDSWLSHDVPLGEERELYILRVLRSGTVLREVETGAPAWTYSAAMRAADGGAGPLEFAVAQISAQYGAGPFERITFDD